MKTFFESNLLKLHQERFIKSILEGKLEFSQLEIQTRMEKLQLDVLKPLFVVVNVAPDYTGIEFEHKDYLIYAIEQLTKSWLRKKEIVNFCLTNSYNNVCILISVSHAEIEKWQIDELFIELREKIINKFQLESFVGIGSVVDSYQKISSSATDAHEMLSYKYRYANQGVINVANLVKFQCNASLENRIAFDRVIGCFQDGNLGKMAMRLEELVEQVRNRSNVSKTSIKRTMVEVVVHILHVASNANIDVDEVLGDMDPYRWIMKQNHTEVITEWIMKISSELLVKIHKQKVIGEKSTIQKTKDYIMTHLGDANLGLQQISEKMDFSSSYFSQLFKKETGVGVNAYIVQSRIERAKELLKETKLKCEDIALQTGFSSAGYFVQVFKKNVGMTPGQFRKDNRNKKN